MIVTSPCGRETVGPMKDSNIAKQENSNSLLVWSKADPVLKDGCVFDNRSFSEFQFQCFWKFKRK